MSRWMRRLGTAGFVGIFSGVFFAAIQADAADLVRDLNDGRGGPATYVGNQGVDSPTGTLLTLHDEAHGSEPWFTDYTLRGTRLFRDLFPGRAASVPSFYTKLGDITVFVARDALHGIELWRTDGTLPGTYLLADIGPGKQHFGDGSPLIAHGGIAYFAADDGVTGSELWRTDGTREGTHLVADIVPGYQGSFPSEFTASTSLLFFKRAGSAWVSDGTGTGTRKIADLANVGSFNSVGNKVFFAANDEVHGTELWRADADGQNVQMVANLNTLPVGGGQDGTSDPSPAFTRGNSLFFIAQIPLIPPNGGTASDCKLFRTDASGTGVTEIVNFRDRCGISKVINLPAGTMFSLYRSGAGDVDELWITDGTPAGTQRLDLGGLYYSMTIPSDHFKVAYGTSGEAYFFGELPGLGQPDKVWRTDGTRGGTRVFVDLSTSSQSQEIALLNGRLYFDTGEGTLPAGNELWTSDGTSAGTFRVRDIQPGILDTEIANLRVANGRLLFFAGSRGNRLEMWTSDGTLDGTVNLGKSVEQSSTATGDSNVAFAGQIGSRVLFAADRGPGAQGRELNISDGTTIGTSIVRDINTGGSADPDNFLMLGDRLLFVARDFDRGRELWRTDGTEAGTLLLKDIVNAGDDGNITLGAPGTILNGIAYFTAGPTLTSAELWRTDGTVAGTFKVPGSVGARIAIVGGTGSSLLYTAYTGSAPAGVYLWSFDGSTAQILGAANGLKISAESGITFDGRVCFRAWEVDPGKLDVWCSNGTPGDLVRATNLVALGSTAGDMRVAGNKLLVNALGSGAAGGLYATTGAAAGMQKISGERIVSAKAYGNTLLVFTTENGGLRLTDGSSAGTRNLLQGATLPGPVPGAFGVLGSHVVFMVNDPQRGALVWRTDGTASGARYLADLDPGTEPATLESNQFQAFGERLLFSAYKTGIGNELWSLSAMDPNASDDAASATGGVTLTVNVLDNDADFDGSLNVASVSIITQPLHGTATVNTATGAITYTATTSYSGMDLLGYRVLDDQGRASNQGMVTLQVTAGSSGNPPANPPTSPPSNPPSGGGGGGAMGIEMLWLLALVVLNAAGHRRYRRSPVRT